MNSGSLSSLTKSTHEAALKECVKDIQDNLKNLQKSLYVSKKGVDFPIAFATNAFYIMERYGLGNK